MTLTGKLLFLGTGGSMGIPVIGCECAVCRSNSDFDKRLRPSALVTIGEKRFLIDTGPDLRQQALRYHLKVCDGILLTHAHNDHVAGMDELRLFYLYGGQKPLPLLLSPETYKDVSARFGYMFGLDPRVQGLMPAFDAHLLKEERGTTEFVGIKIGYCSYFQVGMKVNGFRFGDMAYISDIRNYPETIFEDLQGVRTLILTALRFTPSNIHLSVDEAVAFAERVGAEHTWLTHIAHDLDHKKTNAYLPSHIRLAYDGLEIVFPI